MQTVHPYDGWVRRIDVLLRARFPMLVTRIFQVDKSSYRIVFARDAADAGQVAPVFESNIRFVTAPVTVSNDLPEHFLREVRPIADRDISSGFEGFPLTIQALVNTVAARFPDLPVAGVSEGFDDAGHARIAVALTEPVSETARQDLLAFVAGLGFPAEVGVDVDLSRVPAACGKFDDPMQVVATRFRNDVPAFTREDEAYWFDNIDAVYRGEITDPWRTEYPSSCYMDAGFEGHVNLRQALLLYETVHLSPPLQEGMQAFLADQHLTGDDLCAMAAAGRLKLVLNQPEERLSRRLLDSLHETKPGCIVGRRRTAALVLADLVETCDEYQFNDPSLYGELRQACEIAAEVTKAPAGDIARFLLWPPGARRMSPQVFLERGSKACASLGLAELAASSIKGVTDVDVTFEALMLSEQVHVGHALRATVLPSRKLSEGHVALMNVMGDSLNAFRSLNTRFAASWIGEQVERAQGRTALPALPVFEFFPEVTVAEILAETRYTTHDRTGAALMDRLARMGRDERQAEVAALAARMRSRGVHAGPGFMSLENVDDAMSVASFFGSFAWPPLGATVNIARRAAGVLRAVPAFERLASRLVGNMRSDASRETDFLSRVSRVARLHIPTIH